MSIRLTKKEKLYIVACFGEIPAPAAARLYRMSKMPAIPAVMEAARPLVSYIERIAVSRPKGRKRGPKAGTKARYIW